ncbi:MAG: HNH endonuclease [Muribaculaceae bacterium]|nr:HNH endonuclease [Muribaculaceae bacterium]
MAKVKPIEGEIWKVAELDSKGTYMVSNMGRVIGPSGKLLKLPKLHGYPKVKFWNGRYVDSESVHRLVAKAFILNPDNKPEVDHINTIRDDNRVENLRWVTTKENLNNPLTKKKFSEVRKGHVESEEWRRNKSLARMGKRYALGYRWTAEQRARCSERQKGEGNPFYGKKHSPETIAKMSDAHKKTARKVRQYTLEGVFIREFESSRMASEELKICKRNINACAAGRAKTAGGFVWEYVGKEVRNA